MLFAVATKDGKEINQHFGHAERFLIYEVEGESVRLVDERPVERYCSSEGDHQKRAHILSAITSAVQGCRAVVCAMMGEAPKLELERSGIESFVIEGEVKEVLPALAKLL